ncbi:MAG: hypothetical protein HYS07_05025 [Chlamydiae bacterium]|nr:hypothetical protein [Chlamydiota bacterium]MBI3276254.1 hypothetical protein [Chlamydiota bacterium]
MTFVLGKSFEDVTVVAPERLGQDQAYVIDSTKARKTLGWSNKISLNEGVGGVVAWIEKYWDQIVKEPLEYVHHA